MTVSYDKENQGKINTKVVVMVELNQIQSVPVFNQISAIMTVSIDKVYQWKITKESMKQRMVELNQTQSALVFSQTTATMTVSDDKENQ